MIEIKSTLRESPVRLLVYGKGGIGKSTLAASAPRPIFLASEDGLDNINAVAAMPATWAELLQSIDEVAGLTAYDTIVIDSLDHFEPMCWDHVCKAGDDKGPRKSIEDFGYGKGYTAALNEWRILLSKLSLARNKGKAIVLIAHALKRTVKNLAGEDYDAWGIKLNEKAAGLLREWVDVVAFAEQEIVVSKYSPGESVKGIATGKRVLRTNPSAIYESKTRYDLPPKMPLEWKTLSECITAGSQVAIPLLRVALQTALETAASPELEERSKAFLARRGESVAAYREALTNVNNIISQSEKKEVA